MVAVAILAAGRGTRMISSLPKVLHRLGGRSLVERVLLSLGDIPLERRFVIVGYGADLVCQELASLGGAPPLEFVEQPQQLGTGHAIQQLLPHLVGFSGTLLVLNGDVPLLRPQTLELLLKTHHQSESACALLTAHLPNPQGYGRVFCDEQKFLRQIIEDRDCSPAQKQNRRINAGIYCFRWRDLEQILPQLTSNNDQKEYYLTDAVNYLDRVVTVDAEDYQEILGVNDRQQLAIAQDILQVRIKDDWMRRGVTLVDPGSITIEDTVHLEPDVVLEPQTHLRGKTLIQGGARIGPGSLVENSCVQANATVLFSVVSDSVIERGCRVGPYAHLRGGTQVGEGCRIGNFVEIKHSVLGSGTNVAHLSYLGDATLGQQVNVGAGTITANYDGVKKHPTQIGDRCKTGSNSVLVAPITLGADVTVAAGSVITRDVPADCLAISRPLEVHKPGWRPKSVLPTPDPE